MEDEGQAKEDPEELDQHRRTAEQFHISRPHRGDQSAPGGAHQTHEKAEHDAEDDADEGELERRPQARKQSAPVVEQEAEREMIRHRPAHPPICRLLRRSKYVTSWLTGNEIAR